MWLLVVKEEKMRGKNKCMILKGGVVDISNEVAGTPKVSASWTWTWLDVNRSLGLQPGLVLNVQHQLPTHPY